jgi:Tol biopolymer transport system component
MPGILAAGGIALSPKGGRLIYPSAHVFENLQRLPLDELGRVSGPPQRLTSTTGSDLLPRYSFDGKSVAFTSSRFGEDGIWTVNVSNSATTALATSADATLGLGDWARDGNSLVLFRTTPPSGHWQLYQIAADTRQAKRLTNDDADDFFPNYSRDGNPIYFSSDRSGKVKLYKMPAAGGPATLVVSRNVTNAQESPDRRWLYFADWVSVPGLWHMPAAGGEITRVAEPISDAAGYAPTNQGVYYWAGRLRPELHFINLQSHENRLLFQPSTLVAPNLANFSGRPVSLLSANRTQQSGTYDEREVPLKRTH